MPAQEAQKDMLKVAGFGWLAVAATHAYNAQVTGSRSAVHWSL
jgi:hypothetical protein